jgi:ribosomal protein S18 acetylase RimI-like enzyme
MNSVSSVLSSNEKIFVSGAAIKGSPGWWSLHQWEAPVPPETLAVTTPLKRSYTDSKASEDESIDSCSDSSSGSDLIVDDDEEEVVVVESHDIDVETPVASSAASNNYRNDDKNPSAESNNYTNDDKNHKILPSADLKQQLLERLLLMDSSLLQNAIKKAKAKKQHTFETAVSSEASPPLPLPSPLVKIPAETRRIIDAVLPSIRARLTAAPVIRASPYENDLLKKCNRVDYRAVKVAARLRRKLLLRRQRRQANLMLFDLDQWIYLYLKSSAETPLLLLQDTLHKQPRHGDELPPSFDLQSIPYIADPSKSLYVKLTGMAALYGTCPFPVVSPFSGKTLPPFIAEEEECRAPKLAFLNQLKGLRSLEDSDQQVIDFDSLLKPSYTKQATPQTSPQLRLKYSNLRKEFVKQCNDLLSDSFWPGINIAEALDCPDYAIIALVGLSVVGCAICNADGYLSYLYIRPDFQGYGIASKLLQILIPRLASHKDLTLHVSVSNSAAMILYQRLGFKPEEFVVNFYDKYLQDPEIITRSLVTSNSTTISNKNAFFMRLRR